MSALRLGMIFCIIGTAPACDSAEHPQALAELTRYEVPEPSQAFSTQRLAFSTEEFGAFWEEHSDLSREEAVRAFEEHVVLSVVAQQRLNPDEKGDELAKHQELELSRKKAMIRLMLAKEIEKFSGKVSEQDIQYAQAFNRQPKGARASHVLVMTTDGKSVGERGLQIAQRIKEALPPDPDGLDLVKIQREFEMEEPLRLHVDLQLVFPFASQEYQELPAGWVSLGPAFVKAAHELGDVGVTEPFETRFGWHVAIIHEVLPAKEPTLEDARVLAQHASDVEIRKEKYQEFIEKERAASHYQMYPSVVRERSENKL